MTEQQQRTADYERDEKWLKSLLENARLSSDSALKRVNEMSLQLGVLQAEIEAHNMAVNERMERLDEKMDAVTSRLDKAQGWLITLCTGVFLFLFQQVFVYFQHLPVAK